MPELIILISALACGASAFVLYFNRSSAIAAGVAVLSFIAVLYGIGQRAEQSRVEQEIVQARSPELITPAGLPPVQVSGVNDTEQSKRIKAEAEAEAAAAKNSEASTLIRRQTEGITSPVAKNLPGQQPTDLPLSPPTQLNAFGPISSSVTISNFSSRKTATKYVEVSGTVNNTNGFPIKNFVLRCGDISYASADVSTVVDKVVPARSTLNLAGVKLGPIRPEMPPTTCLIVSFDRAE